MPRRSPTRDCPEHALGALDPATATALLAASGPQLTPAARSRLLREAAGNPLALIELPLAGPAASLPGDPLPLTARLERAFAARVADLPESTGWLLLAAAVDDEEHIGEVLQAGSLAAGAELDADDLQPAADAAIVELDVHAVRFRHPLMRSAVLQAASPHRRRRVHEALAATLHEQPDRAVWHRAALLAGSTRTSPPSWRPPASGPAGAARWISPPPRCGAPPSSATPPGGRPGFSPLPAWPSSSGEAPPSRRSWTKCTARGRDRSTRRVPPTSS